MKTHTSVRVPVETHRKFTTLAKALDVPSGLAADVALKMWIDKYAKRAAAKFAETVES